MGETRAVLVTDVVDSTTLSERLGDSAMTALWARHDALARDLLRVHHGREIDKSDGFLLLFDGASDAVDYAVAYHRALRALDPPLEARVGLHFGDVILTENPSDAVGLGAKPIEVHGLAKPIAARVMSVSAGGQTLLTEAARTSLGATKLRLTSHGHWRMKGIADPMELFEVGDADAPFTPPPDGAKGYRVVTRGDLWLPVKEVKHSLPTERDKFVGRQVDLHALAHRLEQGATLVSVLGIGGCGKTRLVTRYGWTWLGDYPGGVWFCDLSEARTVEGIAYAVAQALDVPLGNDPVVQLGHAIAGRGRCLVILDNFEQVARHATETLGHWLDRASDAQFVVTSREVLGLPGEEALALAPLPPSEGATLFIERARSATRDFEPDDRASIEALVQLLDGLPLAIELAAARVRVMQPKALLDRMAERFQLLATPGGRHNRQVTLRATLDWSWELLSPDEQQALGQLSVFEGGFTLPAAEAVLALERTWQTDAVQALVDKSLIRRVSDERFRPVGERTGIRGGTAWKVRRPRTRSGRGAARRVVRPLRDAGGDRRAPCARRRRARSGSPSGAGQRGGCVRSGRSERPRRGGGRAARSGVGGLGDYWSVRSGEIPRGACAGPFLSRATGVDIDVPDSRRGLGKSGANGRRPHSPRRCVGIGPGGRGPPQRGRRAPRAGRRAPPTGSNGRSARAVRCGDAGRSGDRGPQTRGKRA
jgi:class 3 adenylate cyclase